MKIDHVAFWVKDLERVRNFYVKYFDGTAGERYFNPRKGFSSYFLSFSAGEARMEIMHRPDIGSGPDAGGGFFGITHLALSVGSRERVDALTERLRADQFTILGEPRTTGDGYYESVVLDPEGNQIEITV